MSNLKNCPSCNHEVSKSAKTCPNCGKKLKMGIFKKGLIAVILLIVIAVIMQPSTEEQMKEIDATIAQIKKAPQDAPISGADLVPLFSMISENTDIQRDNAEKKMKGKIIEWTAEVFEVSKNSSGSYKIQTIYSSFSPGTFTYVFPSNKEQISLIESLKTGDQIKIKGRVKSVIMRNFVIDPAIIL